MKPIKSEKITLDDLFKEAYSEPFSDLIEAIEIVKINENSDKLDTSYNGKSRDTIVINNLEVGSSGLKIAQLHLSGMLAKTLIVLAVVGLLFHLLN